MSWLERAAREIGKAGERPTIKTIETPVSEVLKVPHPSVSEKSECGESTPPLPPKACATCAQYTVAPGKTPAGWCGKHRAETWGAYAGGCASDWTPADQATRTLERRRAAVVARLEADPALKRAFDVVNATPTGPAEGPVSVLLGVRMADGSITTGELRIPGNRWPGIAVFAEFWDAASERPAS